MTHPNERKRPQAFEPSLLTAQDLRSGAVLWRGGDGSWIHDARAARLFDDAAAAAAELDAARREAAAAKILDPMLVPAAAGAAGPIPAALRERIRAAGPTIALPVDRPEAR